MRVFRQGIDKPAQLLQRQNALRVVIASTSRTEDSCCKDLGKTLQCSVNVDSMCIVFVVYKKKKRTRIFNVMFLLNFLQKIRKQASKLAAYGCS
jgi:hypothetical protein